LIETGKRSRGSVLRKPAEDEVKIPA